MRRKQAVLRFNKAVEVCAIMITWATTSDTRSDLGEIGTRRHHRKGGRPAGTHRHRPQSLQGAVYGSAAQRDSGMDIDGQRVREAAHAFWKRSGDGDAQGTGRRHMGNTCKLLPVQTAESLDGGSGHAVGKTVGYDGQDKEWHTHHERFPPNCNAPCNSWLARRSTPDKPTVWPCRPMRSSSSCAAWWSKQTSGGYPSS